MPNSYEQRVLISCLRLLLLLVIGGERMKIGSFLGVPKFFRELRRKPASSVEVSIQSQRFEPMQYDYTSVIQRWWQS